MRNHNYAELLQAWAAHHGLRPSERFPCGHAVLGRGLNSDAHARYCVAARLDLLNHALVWNYKRTRIVLAFPYRPSHKDVGFASYWLRVEQYADQLGITAYMPPAGHRLHSLYASDTCAVVYGPKGADLKPLIDMPSEEHRPRARGKRTTPEQVLEIRRLHRDGATYAEIAERFGASTSTVMEIVKRHTYRDVPEEPS